jgi:hypothetical protein
VRLLNLDDDIADNGGHDCHGSDSNVFRSSKCPVQDETNKAGVKAVLSRQLREEGVGHALGNYNEADCDTCNDVAEEPCQVVMKNPVPEREEADKVALNRTS